MQRSDENELADALCAYLIAISVYARDATLAPTGALASVARALNELVDNVDSQYQRERQPDVD